MVDFTVYSGQDESPFLQRKSFRSAAGVACSRRRFTGSNNDVRVCGVRGGHGVCFRCTDEEHARAVETRD